MIIRNIEIEEFNYMCYDFEKQSILGLISNDLYKKEENHWVQLKQLCYEDISDKIIIPKLNYLLWEDNDNYYCKYNGIWKISKNNLSNKSLLWEDWKEIEKLEFSQINNYKNIKIFIKYLFEKNYISELHFRDNLNLSKGYNGKYNTAQIIKNTIDF